MEMDDLYLDVFIPPQTSRQRESDHGLHANQDSRKHSPHKTGLGEMQADGCCKLIADESSVDIYGDLSMDTVYFEDHQHSDSPSKQEENLQKCSGSWFLATSENCSHTSSCAVNVGQSKNMKETLDKLVKELQDKVSELEKENKELRQCKEQVIVNISSLCLTARKVIQKKDEEISKLSRANEKRQQSTSTLASKSAQTQFHLTSEYVQTELHMASKYVQTVFQQASKAVQTPGDLQCLENSTYVCRIKSHEQFEKNGSFKEPKPNVEKNNGQKILCTSSSQVCPTETSGAQVIGGKCEGKGKEKDGLSYYQTGPEKNVHVHDLRRWLNGKRKQSIEKKEQFFGTQASTAGQEEESCSSQTNILNLATSVPFKVQKMVSKQSTVNRKELLSGKRSLKTPEKKYRSEIRDRLQREINLSVSLAECQGVASRNKAKVIPDRKKCKMGEDNNIPSLKSKCMNQTGLLDQDKDNLNTSSTQGKQVTLHSCFIKSPHPTSPPSLEMTSYNCAALSADRYQIKSETNGGIEGLAVCKEDLKNTSRLHALASHQQGLSSYPCLLNTAQITQNIEIHNSEKSHEKLLPVASEDSEKRLPANKKRKKISNGMSCAAVEKSGNMLSKVVSSGFCEDASLSVADKASSDFDVTVSSLPTDSQMKRQINCSHHMYHVDNLVETVKTFSGQAVQVNGSRTQSPKTKKNFDDSKNTDHNRQDCDSANELNFAVLTQDIDCDRNSNCNLEMITDKEKLLTLSSPKASVVDAVFEADYLEQKDGDKTYKHAGPEQITHVTCTSNLILLGDEETSFGSPNKSQHFPTEFYPPGERGQVHDKGSHQRHIRGVPEIVCKEMVDKELTFQNRFNRTPDSHKSMTDFSFDEMSTNTGNRHSDIELGNQDYMKSKQSITSSNCETHKVMSKMNMAPSGVKNHKGQGRPVVADIHEKKMLSFAASSLPTFRYREGLLTVQNKQIQGIEEHWMSAVRKTFKEAFDKDMSSFKKERALHLEARLVHRQKKAKLLREFQKNRSTGWAKMKPRKLSSADSQILSASFIVQTTDDNKKCSVSPKLRKHLSNGQCKKAFSSNDSYQQPLSDDINLRHTNKGLETKTVLEQENKRKLFVQLSPELSNRDMNVITSPTHQNSMWEPVLYEPDSTCDDQAKAGQHWLMKGKETYERDEKIMKTLERDHQWSIIPAIDADEISIASASLSEFDNDVVAAKTVCSPPSVVNLCPDQEIECRDRFIKQKQSNTPLNTLKGDIIENSLQSHKTLSEKNMTKHCAMTAFTSEISAGGTDSFHSQKQPKVTENSCLSRHMTWLQVQQLKASRKSTDIEWKCPADKSRYMKQVKHKENLSYEKHSDSGSLDTKTGDAAYPREQNLSSSHGSQNMGLNLHSDTEEAVLNGDLLSNTNHKLQLKLCQYKTSSIETENEIRSVICNRESLKPLPKDEQVFSDIEEGEIQDDISVRSHGHVRNNRILSDDETGQQCKKTLYGQSLFKEITSHEVKQNNFESRVCQRRQGSFKMRQSRKFCPRPAIEPYRECERDTDSFKTWTPKLYSKKFEKGTKRQRSPSTENFQTVKFMDSQTSSVNKISQKHDIRQGDKQRRKELGCRQERKQGNSEDRQFEESRHQKCDRHSGRRDRRKGRTGHTFDQEKKYGKKKRDVHTEEANLAHREVKGRPRVRVNERKHSVDHKQTFGSTYNKSLENHKWTECKESRSKMQNKNFMPCSVSSAASEYHVTDRQTVIKYGNGVSKKPERDHSNSQIRSTKRRSRRNECCK